jgi:hypothetical protein
VGAVVEAGSFDAKRLSIRIRDRSEPDSVHGPPVYGVSGMYGDGLTYLASYAARIPHAPASPIVMTHCLEGAVGPAGCGLDSHGAPSGIDRFRPMNPREPPPLVAEMQVSVLGWKRGEQWVMEHILPQ